MSMLGIPKDSSNLIDEIRSHSEMLFGDVMGHGHRAQNRSIRQVRPHLTSLALVDLPVASLIEASNTSVAFSARPCVGDLFALAIDHERLLPFNARRLESRLWRDRKYFIYS
jgi:hypothetical protein